MFYVIFLKIKIIYFWQTKCEFIEKKNFLFNCFNQPGPARQKLLICVEKSFLKIGIKNYIKNILQFERVFFGGGGG